MSFDQNNEAAKQRAGYGLGNVEGVIRAGDVARPLPPPSPLTERLDGYLAEALELAAQIIGAQNMTSVRLFGEAGSDCNPFGEEGKNIAMPPFDVRASDHFSRLIRLLREARDQAQSLNTRL